MDLTLTRPQGGFARVYEVLSPDGVRRAVKVVNKANIKTKKNKTKASRMRRDVLLVLT